MAEVKLNFRGYNLYEVIYSPAWPCVSFLWSSYSIQLGRGYSYWLPVFFTEKGRLKFTGKSNGVKLVFMSTLRLDLMDPLGGEKCWLACLLLLFSVFYPYLLLTVAACLPPGRSIRVETCFPPARVVSLSGQDWTGSHSGEPSSRPGLVMLSKSNVSWLHIMMLMVRFLYFEFWQITNSLQ